MNKFKRHTSACIIMLVFQPFSPQLTDCLHKPTANLCFEKKNVVPSVTHDLELLNLLQRLRYVHYSQATCIHQLHIPGSYNYHQLAPPRKSADRTVPALWLISPVGTTFVVSRTISSFNPQSLNLAYHILHFCGLPWLKFVLLHSLCLQWMCLIVCYGQHERAWHLHPNICTRDASLSPFSFHLEYSQAQKNISALTQCVVINCFYCHLCTFMPYVIQM